MDLHSLKAVNPYSSETTRLMACYGSKEAPPISNPNLYYLWLHHIISIVTYIMHRHLNFIVTSDLCYYTIGECSFRNLWLEWNPYKFTPCCNNYEACVGNMRHVNTTL